MSKTEEETVKQKLHKNIGCDIRLLVEVIDELRNESKIEGVGDNAHTQAYGNYL